MVTKGWAETFDTWEDVVTMLGTADVALSNFALISKEKPDGSINHRLIWDLLRSNVNASIRQAERIVLPRLLDVVRNGLHFHSLARGSYSSQLASSSLQVIS